MPSRKKKAKMEKEMAKRKSKEGKKEAQSHKVTDQDGKEATISSLDQNDSTGQPQMLIELNSTTSIIVPANLLASTGSGEYYLLARFSDLKPEQTAPDSRTLLQAENQEVGVGNTLNSKNKETLVVPLISERVLVEKRVIEKGKIVLHKRVSEHEETVDEPLLQDEYKIERVVLNQEVSSPPPVRYEGDTMIIPILQEVLVVQKRLIVKEELHLIKQQTTIRQPQTINLRTEEIEVENLPPDTVSSAREQNLEK